MVVFKGNTKVAVWFGSLRLRMIWCRFGLVGFVHVWCVTVWWGLVGVFALIPILHDIAARLGMVGSGLVRSGRMG